jgi:hypothetical protein
MVAHSASSTVLRKMAGREKQYWEKLPWTEREEQILVAYSFEFENHWKRYEKVLPGRSAQAIRQKWKELTKSVRTVEAPEEDLLPKEEEEVQEKKEEEEEEQIDGERVEDVLSWF